MKKILPQLIFISGLIAFLTLFFQTFTYQGETVPGSAFLLEGTIHDLTIGGESVSTAEMVRNPLIMLAFILPLIGGGFAIYNAKLSFVSVIGFIVGAAFLYVGIDTAEISYTILGGSFTTSVPLEYGTGAIIYYIASGIGALLSLGVIIDEAT